MPKILVLDDFIEKLYLPKSRPSIHRIFIWGFFITSFYSLGKMGALILLTEPRDIRPPTPPHRLATASLAPEIQAITNRDLFNSLQNNKKIFKTQKEEKEEGPCLSSTTSTSSPALTLLNTIILQNSKKSVAAVQKGVAKDVLSLKQGDDIPGVGKVGLIEALRITFRSFQTGECEFLSMEKKSENYYSRFSILSADEGQKLLKKKDKKKSISQQGNRFRIKRAYINEGLNDLPNLLNKGKATPIKNSNGTLAFKITEINPGSLFTKLGIQNEDQIHFIDDKPIRSQSQIFSLFNSLKTIRNISITVLRNGSKQKLEYTLVD